MQTLHWYTAEPRPARKRASYSTSCKLQLLTYLSCITEGQFLTCHFLPGFMAFAGNQNKIVRRRHTDGKTDRLCPIVDNRHSVRAGKSGQNVRHDLLRVLGSWIVVGYDHHIGTGLCLFGHLRAFATIAIATTSEHTNQPASYVRSQG